MIVEACCAPACHRHRRPQKAPQQANTSLVGLAARDGAVQFFNTRRPPWGTRKTTRAKVSCDSLSEHMKRLADNHAEGQGDTHWGEDAGQRRAVAHARILAAQGVSWQSLFDSGLPRLLLLLLQSSINMGAVLGQTLSSERQLAIGKEAEPQCLALFNTFSCSDVSRC